jgi:small neutral amino acid transporter SnatA (MarC family)
MGMEHTFASATILLLLITDPLGNIPIFVNTLRAVPPERRARVIVREVLIAFGLLLAFMFVGQSFLKAWSLSDVSLQIGGAVVLFLIAVRMIFPPPPQDAPVPVAEPLIVPLAIPALALGLWLWLVVGIGRGTGQGWMHAKLGVVLLLIAYHHSCGVLLRKFINGQTPHGHVWFRWFNEAPVLLMLVAVVLVVVKPF